MVKLTGNDFVGLNITGFKVLTNLQLESGDKILREVLTPHVERAVNLLVPYILAPTVNRLWVVICHDQPRGTACSPKSRPGEVFRTYTMYKNKNRKVFLVDNQSSDGSTPEEDLNWYTKR